MRLSAGLRQLAPEIEAVENAVGTCPSKWAAQPRAGAPHRPGGTSDGQAGGVGRVVDMRRVERGPAPDLVQAPEFVNLRHDYQAFQATGGTRVTQTKLDPLGLARCHRAIAGGYVPDLFHGKCAYTEVAGEYPLPPPPPRGRRLRRRRGISAAHYWWTATWYRNWYLASNHVAALKRNNFPVLGERAPEPTATSSDVRASPPPRTWTAA